MATQVNIRHVRAFGSIAAVGVHQVCEDLSDIDNAVYTAERDGFETIWLYVADADDADLFCDEVCAMLPDAMVNVRVLRLA